MTQTLMANFDDPVFPDTDRVLFLGGPKHGQILEVVRGDPIHKVMGPPAPPVIAPEVPLLSGGGVPEVHTYLRRELAFRDENGEAWRHVVYMHDEIPNEIVAQRVLMAHLIAEFAKQGQRVIEHDVPDPRSFGGS